MIVGGSDLLHGFASHFVLSSAMRFSTRSVILKLRSIGSSEPPAYSEGFSHSVFNFFFKQLTVCHELLFDLFVSGLIPDAVFEPVPFHARKLQVIRTLSHHFYLRQIFPASIFRKTGRASGQGKERKCRKNFLHHCASFPLKNLACENTAMSPVEEEHGCLT